MKRSELKKLDKALETFLNQLTNGMGREERRQSMMDYVTGLLLDGRRKSIVPMASRLVQNETDIEAMRQRLQQCVSNSKWVDEEFRGRLTKTVIERLDNPEAIVIDDTGFPKKGKHSVGVARQYSGSLGRVDNCQVAVSSHIASRDSSCCLDMQLYLPKSWTDDEERMKKSGVPSDISFEPKSEIALKQLDRLLERGIPKLPVLADSGYGDGVNFRNEIRKKGCEYLVGITGDTIIWTPESNPRIPKKKRGAGRPNTKYQDKRNPPILAIDYAISLGRKAVKKLTWDTSPNGPKSSYFGAARIRNAHDHIRGRPPGEEEWLIWQWPKNKDAPTKFWLSSLPKNTTMKRLVYLAKLRWRVERDYQEMKQEVGLSHFEGRTWRGFHHHATLCMAAHAFLVLCRTIFPPQ